MPMKHMRSRTREFWIPAGATKVADKATGAAAYLYQSAKGPAAMVFARKATKPAWRYWFRNEQDRTRRISEYFAALKARADRVAADAAARKAEGRGVEVGDVLRSSWGYDQTNVDYYEVTALVGKAMVELRELCQERTETGFMQGRCVPLPGQYAGDPFRCFARAGVCKVGNSYKRNAYVITPDIVGGVPVYKPDGWTSYS